MMTHKRLWVLLLLLLGLAGLPVLAEDAAVDDSDDTEGESGAGPKTEVVRVEASAPYIPEANTIATRLPVSLLDTPTNVGTVGELLIRDQYAFLLGGTLRNISSVNAQSETGVADYFLIRGFDSLSSALVLTDGAAEPEVSFFQTYNVERVEVLKGPGGFLYSRNGLSGALAGAVNIVRRQPMPTKFTRVGVSGGSFQTYQGTLDWNHTNRQGNFGTRLNALYRESAFYRDEKQNETWGVNPAFTWWLGSDTAVNVNLEYTETEHQPDSGIPIVANEVADVSRTTSYQSPFDFSDQQIARVQVDYQTRLSDRWNLRNKTYYRELDWQSNGTLFNGVFPNPVTFQDQVSRTLTILDDRQNLLGNQIEGVFQATKGGVEHNLLAGVELAIHQDEFDIDLGCDPTLLGFTGQCILPSIDVVNPVETATTFVVQDPVNPDDPNARFEGDSQTLVAAPYAIYQVKVNDRFQALAGARFDYVDFEDDLSGLSRSDSGVSPMLGVVFKPSDRMSLYASASESFGPPSPRVDVPESEEGRQFELGYKVEHPGGRLQATVAVYQLERDNIPIPDENAFTQQAGDQRSRGFEIDLAAEPISGLRTFLSYSYTDAEFTSFTERVIVGLNPVTFQPIFGTVDRTGNTPAFVPEHLANLWVTQRFTNGFGYGAGLRYVGEQFISEDNAFAIDDYLLADAALYFRYGRWDFQINIRNVTDEEYETRGFSSTSVIPGPERSAFMSFEVRF